MGKLQDRVLVVTGAAQGQGRSIAEAFHREGACVALTDIQHGEGEALARELGSRTVYLPLDVTDESQWHAVVAQVRRRFGKLDGLVNNAGIFRYGAIGSTDLSEWDRVIATDQTSVFLGMKTCHGAIAAAGGGTIVNTSSTAAYRGLPGTIAYSAAKWAIRGMTKVAANEFGPMGIRVNSVHPGTIDTAMSSPESVSGWSSPARSNGRNIPIDRKGMPDEVAQLVVFLSCGDSSFCTGAEFVIDGGELAGPMKR